MDFRGSVQNLPKSFKQKIQTGQQDEKLGSQKPAKHEQGKTPHTHARKIISCAQPRSGSPTPFFPLQFGVLMARSPPCFGAAAPPLLVSARQEHLVSWKQGAQATQAKTMYSFSEQNQPILNCTLAPVSWQCCSRNEDAA